MEQCALAAALVHMVDPILFDGSRGLLRVLVVGVVAYPALVLMLRLTGKRTLSKLNAFDFLVTVALGSTLASLLLSDGVALAEGLLALALLILLQFAVTWTSVRWPRFQGWIKAEPSLLYHEGCFLHEAMRRERVTRAEMEAAMRQSGHGSFDQVQAMVLETDGSLSVIAQSGA